MRLSFRLCVLCAASLAGSLAVSLVWAGCSSETPSFRPDVVVEAFLNTGDPLPDVLVRQTMPPSVSLGDDRLQGALVVIASGRRADTLRAVPGQPGRYRAAAGRPADTVRAATSYRLTVRRGDVLAEAQVVPPPRLRLAAARAFAAATPERGVNLDLGSFGLGSTVANGYFYAIDVEIEWVPSPDTSFVVRANLRPGAGGSTLFFPTDVVSSESTAGVAASTAAGPLRRWRRRYLVGVDGPTSPLPPHRVRVALVRGDEAFRQFVETRRTPSQRSPTSNVTGGLGIVAGLSTDSLTLDVGR